jgi:hypothetical protein
MLTRTLHPKHGYSPLQFSGFLEFWIDARFYLGWALGLLMTPFPFTPTALKVRPPPDNAGPAAVTR